MALDDLTDRERAVYTGILTQYSTVPECALHATAYAAGVLLGYCPYSFEMKDWSSVDSRLKDCDNCVAPFSQELHEIINSLEEKMMVQRDPDNAQVLHILGLESWN